MMKRVLSGIGTLTLTVTLSACAGFEHQSSNPLTPTLPDSAGVPTLPSVPSGAGLTGTWSSGPLTVPTSWSCGNFQWSITSQTSNVLDGEFAAVCAGIVLVKGNATGQLNSAKTEVAIRLTGTATAQGLIACPFELNGTGYIIENADAIRIPYRGSTCLGPLNGEETLRRPAPSAPPPSVPAPEPPPSAPSGNPYHVAAGPLTAERAEAIVNATALEFAHLTAAPGSESEGIARAEELLLRTIWHLRLAGFDAARQRNPSGAISNDKLTIVIGSWRAFDIFRDLGRPGVEMDLIFLEVFPANPLAYPGIPD